MIFTAKLNDITGQTFGNWKVLYRNGSTPNKASIWHCKCLLCGSEHDVVGASLTNGLSTKCRACVPREALSKPHRHDRIYTVYCGMMQRCYTKSNTNYKNYGGRGITVCDEWFKKPEAFFKWAYSNGYDDSLTLERIDVNKGYSPNNCCWISPQEQARNKSNTIHVVYDGEPLCLAEACRRTGFNYDTVRWRIRDANCTPQEAFDYYLRK